MPHQVWDVVVVGGGTAGCVVAARLSEDPGQRVLLLESGPDVRADAPPDVVDARRPTVDHDWGLVEEPDDAGRVRALPRARLLGGCSATNGTFALRGHRADYDAWAAAGNDGWSFDDVLPLFMRLEHDLDFGDQPWHGNAGPLPIKRPTADEMTDVARAVQWTLEAGGFASVADANAPDAEGVALVPRNSIDDVRISTAAAYLPLRAEPANLTIRCGVEVRDILVEGSRAVGVRLQDGEPVRAEVVVLCAGTYASPVLLLRSGIGPADELGALGIGVVADLPGVGRNLADHPAASVDLAYPFAPTPSTMFQVVATFRSEHASATGPPDLQCMAGGPLANGMFFVATALLKPRSRGRLRLRSADPTAAPRIELGYFRERDDLDRLAEGFTRIRAACRTGHVAALSGGEVSPGAAVPDRDPAALRAWLRTAAWTYHHVVGTCAMGRSDEAVVDPTGRVYGVDGLWVADASVMPDIPSANTMIPTIMVAEHISGFLREGR